MIETGNAVLLVTVEIDPADDEEFNRWYDEEHVPEKLGEPGYLAARRFRDVADGNRYLVIYELDEAVTAARPPNSNPSQQSRDLMARWRQWSRTVWQQLA
jgi:hypothetical protein